MTTNNVLLVGSVPLASAADVFTQCSARLGTHLIALPDGEVGDRMLWVVFQAYRIFDGHPQLQTVKRPSGRGAQPWHPTGLDDMWAFALRPGIAELHFDNLGYADAALASYAVFQKLRDAGRIPTDLRFQVSLPTPLGGMSWFFPDPQERERVLPAYTAAIARELERITAGIPAQDLAVQWDVCWEVLEIEGLFPCAGDPWQRYVGPIAELLGRVPQPALLGYHLCYADLGHRHMVEPRDLGLCVRMANAAAQASGRPVDFVHMPVPRNRSDDAYFAPLRDLAIGPGRVFLGLIHHTDGVAGSRERITTARKYCADFGIATECGFGRRDPATVGPLLDYHRELADALA